MPNVPVVAVEVTVVVAVEVSEVDSVGKLAPSPM